MKPNDIYILRHKKSCDFAMKICEELRLDPIDWAVYFADAYEKGYTDCWCDLSKDERIGKDEKMMDKEIANEYARIAIKALANLIENYSLNPISQKTVFLYTMIALDEFIKCPL